MKKWAIIVGLFGCIAFGFGQKVNSSTISKNKIASNNSIIGKVLCGYQGWFNAKGDGANLEWKHYGTKGFGPGKCTVDYWPD